MHKFTWCSQELAEQCLLQGVHFHVAIRSHSSSKVITPPCLFGVDSHFHMIFDDFEPEKIMKTPAYARDPIKGQDIIKRCFMVRQAEALAAWVDATDLGTTVVVNCEGGVSRSPAIVAAFRRYYGGDVKECFQKAYPNLHVANTLARVLGVDTFSEADYVKLDPGQTLFT